MNKDQIQGTFRMMVAGAAAGDLEPIDQHFANSDPDVIAALGARMSGLVDSVSWLGFSIGASWGVLKLLDDERDGALAGAADLKRIESAHLREFSGIWAAFSGHCREVIGLPPDLVLRSGGGNMWDELKPYATRELPKPDAGEVEQARIELLQIWQADLNDPWREMLLDVFHGRKEFQ